MLMGNFAHSTFDIRYLDSSAIKRQTMLIPAWKPYTKRNTRFHKKYFCWKCHNGFLWFKGVAILNWPKVSINLRHQIIRNTGTRDPLEIKPPRWDNSVFLSFSSSAWECAFAEGTWFFPFQTGNHSLLWDNAIQRIYLYNKLNATL